MIERKKRDAFADVSNAFLFNLIKLPAQSGSGESLTRCHLRQIDELSLLAHTDYIACRSSQYPQRKRKD